MRFRCFNTRGFIGTLFLPAGIGLLIQTLYAVTLAEKILALALALFCPELARMACVDLENIKAVTQQCPAQSTKGLPTEDSGLSHFFTTTASTIVLEITGFYIALISLPLGAIIIIFSQLWFNLFARIQLWPDKIPAITPFGIAKRWPVLMANTLGLGLISLWPMLTSARIWLASGLLTLIIVFLVIKYAIPGSQAQHPEVGRP